MVEIVTKTGGDGWRKRRAEGDAIPPQTQSDRLSPTSSLLFTKKSSTGRLLCLEWTVILN